MFVKLLNIRVKQLAFLEYICPMVGVAECK